MTQWAVEVLSVRVCRLFPHSRIGRGGFFTLRMQSESSEVVVSVRRAAILLKLLLPKSLYRHRWSGHAEAATDNLSGIAGAALAQSVDGSVSRLRRPSAYLRGFEFPGNGMK